MNWQLNRIQYPVYSLGPGKRIGIWVQGCSLKCRGCLNPDLWNFSGGRAVSIAYLAEQIMNISGFFNGITITGGEPFDQLEPLCDFCRTIKENTNLNIMVYTGYSLEEIHAMPRGSDVFPFIESMIDGRFISDEASSDHMRGSLNQKYYIFKNAMPVNSNEIFSDSVCSVTVDEDGTIFMAGVPGPGEISEISLDLLNKGLKVDFR